MTLVAYYITRNLIGDPERMRASFAFAKNVAKCEITPSLVTCPYLTVTLIGESMDRKLYFVKSMNQVPEGARSFNQYEDAYKWAKGKDNTSLVTPQYLKCNEYSRTVSIPEIRHHIIPEIKRIERNIKKGALYTTVIWADGSKPTVVKCAEDDSPDFYFAVASAIAIKLYGSNSAFKRVIKEKCDGSK